MSARSYTLDKRRQGNITVERDLDLITILLHGHEIITPSGTNTYRVSSCLYRTPTTKVAINRFFELMGSDIRVIQTKNNWYLRRDNGNGPFTIDFVDGMEVSL